MVKDLIGRVRTCPEAERAAPACMLARHAREGSSAAFSELCRMAGGGRRTLLARYSSEDQLTGIEALGRTRPKGRSCPAEILAGVPGGVRRVVHGACLRQRPHAPVDRPGLGSFPGRPGGSRKSCATRGPLSSPEDPPVSLTPPQHAERRAQNPFHAAVSRAISRLEEAIGSEA